MKYEHHPKIEIGDRFFKLTVIKIDKNPKKRGLLYECLCDCGGKRSAMAYVLNRGQAKSCGCQNYMEPSSSIKYDPATASYRGKASHYKGSAHNRGIFWNLSTEEAVDLLKSNCHYCNRIPSAIYNVLETRKNSRRSSMNIIENNKYIVKHNGIDRKNNDLGYTKENSVACCKICNFAKNTLPYEEFFDWIKDLIKYRGTFEKI